jgi:hypothetical protein
MKLPTLVPLGVAGVPSLPLAVADSLVAAPPMVEAAAGALLALLATGLRMPDAVRHLAEAGQWVGAAEALWAGMEDWPPWTDDPWKTLQALGRGALAARPEDAPVIVQWLMAKGLHPLSLALEGVVPLQDGDSLERGVAVLERMREGVGADDATLERLALQDHRDAVGRVLGVDFLLGFVDDNSEEAYSGPIPFWVRVEPSSDRNILHWCDTHLDPYWSVTLMEAHPRLSEQLRSLEAYGPSREGRS